MTFSIDVIKESLDPVFKLNVSVYGNNLKIKNARVEVLRRPPKVRITYPDELKNVLSATEQKKLELEMLNKIVEHIIKTSEKSDIRVNRLIREDV